MKKWIACLGILTGCSAAPEPCPSCLEACRRNNTLAEENAELKRKVHRYEETIAAICPPICRTSPPSRIDGRVTAVSSQYHLVILNVGKDSGVREGDDFTIHREGRRVAEIRIERVDRQWSTGRIVIEKDLPRVSDAASNAVLVLSDP